MDRQKGDKQTTHCDRHLLDCLCMTDKNVKTYQKTLRLLEAVFQKVCMGRGGKDRLVQKMVPSLSTL